MSKIILLRFWQVKKNCTTERAPLIFLNNFFFKIKVENKKKCCCEKSHNTNWAIPCIADTELILEYTPALKKTSATKNNGALSSLLMEETVPIHLLCIENPHRLCIDMTVDRVFQWVVSLFGLASISSAWFPIDHEVNSHDMMAHTSKT